MQATVAHRPAVAAIDRSASRAEPFAPPQVAVFWWLGCAAALAAFAWRCWLLGAPSLWYDEGVSWSMARMPLSAMLVQLAHTDFNPPLYPVLLHAWLPLTGGSEYSLRFLSVVAGTVVVPLCWALAKRLFQSALAAALAGVLAGTSLFLIDFSQEARSYSLAAALGLLSVYALLRLMDSPESARLRGWWWVYLLTTTAALYTHYAVLLLMPGHLALLLMRRRQWLAVGMAWLVGALLYLPWLPSLGRQLATMRAVPDFWVGHLTPTLAPERVLAAIAIGPGALPHQTVAVLGGGVLWLIGAGLAALLSPARSRGSALLPTFIVLSALLEAALLTSIVPKFIDRYLLPVAPFAYVATAAFVSPGRPQARSGNQGLPFRRRLSRPAALVVCGVLLLGSVAHTLAVGPSAATIKDGDTRNVVAFIGAHAQRGDGVLLSQDTSAVFSYYDNGALAARGVAWTGVIPEFRRGDDLPVLAAALNAAAQSHTRLWVVLWHTDFADPTGYLRNALDAGATRLLTYTGATNYELRLYQLRPGYIFTPRAAPLQPMSVRFGQHVTFLGVGLEGGASPSDVPFAIHTWFRTDLPLDRDYQVVLRLERDGHVWSQLALRPSLYTYPAQHWLPGVDVPGKLNFAVGEEVPPADYHLTLSFFDPVTHQDLSAVDTERGNIGTQVDLGVVKVLPPQRPGGFPPPERVLSLPVDSGFQLWGSGAVMTHMQQGALVDLPLTWQAIGRPQADYQAQVEVQPASAGSPAVALTSLAPPAPGLGTASWPAGDAFQDERTLKLPARVPTGPATLQVRLVPIGGAGKSVLLPVAQVTIDGRPRNMTPPADIGTPVGALFGDAAFLAGVQIDNPVVQPGGAVAMVLTWQCRATLAQDYTVFVHLLDGANAIGGRQHDGPPNDGLDPTSSWVPNQWITDRHLIPIPQSTPPGNYRIEIGLYRQSHEQFLRLPLPTGTDALIAGTVTVR